MKYGNSGRVCEKEKFSFSCTLEGQHKSFPITLNMYILCVIRWKVT